MTTGHWHREKEGIIKTPNCSQHMTHHHPNQVDSAQSTFPSWQWLLLGASKEETSGSSLVLAFTITYLYTDQKRRGEYPNSSLWNATRQPSIVLVSNSEFWHLALTLRLENVTFYIMLPSSSSRTQHLRPTTQKDLLRNIFCSNLPLLLIDCKGSCIHTASTIAINCNYYLIFQEVVTRNMNLMILRSWSIPQSTAQVNCTDCGISKFTDPTE